MDAFITVLVDGIVLPVTGTIPFLASSGILLAVFAGLWIAFAVALVRDPARIEAAWRRLRGLPLVVQAVAWLLFLPVLAGVWIWRTSLPWAARIVLISGLAGWNVLVFLPAGA